MSELTYKIEDDKALDGVPTRPVFESGIPLPEKPMLGAKPKHELDAFFAQMKVGDSIWVGNDENKLARVVARIKKVHGKGSVATRKMVGANAGPNGEAGYRVWRIEPVVKAGAVTE